MRLEDKIEAQKKRMEQEKNKLDLLVKKAKAEQRKADNHRKIVVGAIFEKYLPEPRRFSEEQIGQLVKVAFATNEVRNCLDRMEKEVAALKEETPDKANEKRADGSDTEEE